MERLRYARKWRWAIEAITNIPFAQAKKEVVRLVVLQVKLPGRR